MTFEEIYKKRGLEYKPFQPQQTPSLQNIVAQIKERRVAKERQQKIGGMIEEGEKAYKEATEAAGWKRIAKETLKGIPDAAPLVFKTLATPEGIMSMGRGAIKGLSLGWLSPETPEDANEIEQAIEEGWKIGGHFGAFLSGEAALKLAFKTPAIAAKLGAAAPKIAYISSWLGTSQLDKEMRGAGFEARAKRAAYDAATILTFEGLGYGLGKIAKKIKIANLPKKANQKAIDFFFRDMPKQLDSPGYSKEAAKIIRGLNISKVKTIDEAMKLVQKSLTPEMLRTPAIQMTLEHFRDQAKKSVPLYTELAIQKIFAKGKPLIKDKAMLPIAKLAEKLKPTKFEPKFKPPEKPIDFKLTSKAKIKALTSIQKEFPGVESISKQIKELETKTKAPITKEIKPTAEGYSTWLKKQPEARKEYKDIQAKIAKISDVKVKKEFIKAEKSKFEIKYSKKYSIALPKMKFAKPKTARITETRALAFSPKNLSKPVSTIIKKETDKIIRRSEIAKTLSEKLDVPIRRGKFRGKALGIYKPSPKVVRMKKGDIPVISHEVGHYLDDTLGLSGMINKTEMVSLTAEYAPKPLSRMDIKGKKKEALAEFIRFYVTEPAKAKKKAPIYSSYFEEVMKKFPEIKEVILKAKQDYKRWTEMPATAKIASMVSQEREKEGLKKVIPEKIKEFYIDIKDDLYPIKLFQNAAKKLLKDKLSSWEMPYLLARLTRGWLGKAETFLEKGTLDKVYWTKDLKLQIKGKSLKEILKPIQKMKALDDFNYYLVNLRVLELSKHGVLTGISKIDALKSFKELNTKYPEFAKTTKEIYKFQDDVLMYGYQSELYSAELLAKIKTKNQFYVPFYRVLEESQVKGYFGKGYANVANELKRMKGSELDIVSPLESIVKNTYAIINASERNTIGLAMANLAGKHYELGRMFEKVSIPMAKVATVNKKDFSKGLMTDFEKVFGFKTQETEGIIDIFRPSMFLPKDNVLTVLKNGKKLYFQVDPMIYKSLAALDKEHASLTLKLLSQPTRWLRAGAILTPEFMIRNPLRDLMGAFVYSKYGFYTSVDFVKGMYSLVGKDDKYWLWRASGGEHSMFVSMDREYLQKSLEEVTKGKGYKGYAKNPLEALRALSEFSETPTRLGEFRRGLAKMDDPLKAAYASREITLDFAKMGHSGKAINNLVVFSNANFESWDKLVRAFKHHPTRTTTRVVMGITIPSILLYVNNRKDPRWKEIPQWQKDLSWIVFTKNPDDIGWDKMTMEEKKKAVKMINSVQYGIYRIPKPFQLGMLFGTIPERILESIDNDDPEAIDQLAENLLSSQSPSITPTILEPLLENWSNYDYFLERPIIPLSKTGLPAEAQFTAYTSEIAKILGKTINYSPAKIENLFIGYFGGLGKHSINTVDSILKGTGIVDKIDPEMQTADKAIVKAFLIRRPIGSSSESVNRFYNKYKSYESREQLLKQYYTNNEMEKYYKYKEKNPELYIKYDFKRKTLYSEPARFYRKVASRISELRKIEAKIYAHKTMDALEKRVKLTDIDVEITRLARKAIEFDIRK